MVHHVFRYRKYLLMLGDVIVFYIAILFTLCIRYGSAFDRQPIKEHGVYFSLILPMTLFVFYVHRLYNDKAMNNYSRFYVVIVRATLLNFFITSVFFYFVPAGIAPKTNLFIFTMLFLFLFLIWRFACNMLFNPSHCTKSAVIVGRGSDDEALAREITSHPEFGYRCTALVNPDDAQAIQQILDRRPIPTIILGSNAYHVPDAITLLYRERNRGYEFITFNEFYEMVIRKIPIPSINAIWVLENIHEQKLFYDVLKRVLDIILAFLFGIPFLLLIVPIALGIKWSSPGPVFYWQRRAGKNAQEFVLIKFRSMVDMRITTIGKFLRQTRLDELPQILNIIKGDMSFIGPRPERIDVQHQLEKHIPFFGSRNLITPGLTGWAQVQYRHTTTALDAVEKLQYDLYYIQHRSLFMDLDIILKTIHTVMERRGQ